MTLQIKNLEEYQQVYAASVADPEGFWAAQASSFHWHKPWDKVLEWNFTDPDINWFKGGKLNISENCLDRHLDTRGDQVAILWEPNDPEKPHVTYTYRELHAAVCQAANALLAMRLDALMVKEAFIQRAGQIAQRCHQQRCRPHR